MSTHHNYYKDKLGFDPNKESYSYSINNNNDDDIGSPPMEKYRRTNEDKLPQGYEENLTKFKDERDAVQKKTFTKWVNKHLKKARRQIRDLFEDLRDGHNLISLLEVLTGEQLPRERGQMRFHMLHNIDTALHFLRCKNVKLVNIRSEDIVDGNPKLTLGLIWTIILHFQISDIVTGIHEPNVSAKDYLLRWAKRTTNKYPGVNVQDFTKSWRDGLAFSSIIHRNRPDLIDFRQARQQRPRERMEQAFYVAEREYGVTRLLDPEDVDTPNPDEKSLITYISSLHEVFPEPPSIHPLYDTLAQQRIQEYRQIASSLQMWIREKHSLMQDHLFPSTLIELKKLSMELTRFRDEELPLKQKEKSYLREIFEDFLVKYFEKMGEIDVEPELHIENIERNWQRLMVAYQERERRISDEIRRLERLQILSEKVHREIKQTDTQLDQIDHAIETESRRIKRLHPLEAKKIADQIDHDLSTIERNIQSLKSDVSTLRNARYPQSSDLEKRVLKLHEKWVNLRHVLHNKIIGQLANLSFPVEERTVTKHIRTVQETRNVETNPHFRSLLDHIEWCKSKLKQLKKADYGTDLQSVRSELDRHDREHKQIDQFHSTIDNLSMARQYFQNEELSLYDQHLGQLQKIYAELLSFSTTRMTDLETLIDFIKQATEELNWLNDKEEVEVKRDWSDVRLDVGAIEKYFEHLMSILEEHEFQFNSVLEKGENLVLQNHPATKAIEAHMAAMNAQWAWLLQLTHCLETHLQNTRIYQQFFKDVQHAELWLKEKDEIMNSEFSQGEFSLDVGERLLEGMQSLRDELNVFGDSVQVLTGRAQNVPPLKQRTQPVTRPITVHAICNYKQNNFIVEKGKECTLTDNSGRTKWKVHNSKGIECQVPGVCFVIPPPDKEALDAVEKLRKRYDRSIALWQKKQLRMRQNMIFATIKVVKGWDLPQFIAIGAEQRNTIRRALNEDADKLMSEGDPSDPQLRRLRREMDEVNRLFDEFEKRARAEEESKSQTKIFNEQVSSLSRRLDQFESLLNQRVMAPLARDLDALQHSVLEHKEFESGLSDLEGDIEAAKNTFRSITLKTPQHKKDLEQILDKHKRIRNTSNIYIERLKCTELLINSMDESHQIITEFEKKIALFKDLPNDKNLLEKINEDLLRLESGIGQHQIAMDQLNDDFENVRKLTEKSRQHRQPSRQLDLDRMEKDVQNLNDRWRDVCAQLADRMRNLKQAWDWLKLYKTGKQVEDDWLDEQVGVVESMVGGMERGKEHLDATKSLLNSIVERTPKIEQVNIVGGKFIREGKIWSKGVQRYREQVVERQPSMDAILLNEDKMAATSSGFPASTSGVSGADSVAEELDEFNQKFKFLLDEVYGRLMSMAEMAKGDIVTLRLVEQMRPQPFKTFRTEFHMSSTNEHSSTFTTTTHYTKQYIQTSTTKNGTAPRPIDELDRIIEKPIIKERTKTINVSLNPEQITETIIKLQNQPLTLTDALTQNLIDPLTGTLTDRLTGVQYRINDAVKDGILIGQSAEIVDSKTGVKVTLNEALNRGLINSSLGTYCRDGDHMSFYEAKDRELIKKPQTIAELINEGSTFNPGLNLIELIKRGVLDGDELKAYYDTKLNESVTLNEALNRGLILTDSLQFKDSLTGELMGLNDATNRGLMFIVEKKSIFQVDFIKPPSKDEWLSFNQALGENIKINQSLIENSETEIKREVLNKLNSPIGIFINDEELTLLDAVNRGLIDPVSGHLINQGRVCYLNDAIALNLITPDGAALLYSLLNLNVNVRVTKTLIARYVTVTRDLKRNVITYTEALRQGLINNELKTFTDKSTNRSLPIVQAISEGVLSPDTRQFDILETSLSKTEASGHRPHDFEAPPDGWSSNEVPPGGWPLREAIRVGLYDAINGLFTIQGTDRLVGFEECLHLRLIDPASVIVVDPSTGRRLSVARALEKKILDRTGHYRLDEAGGRLTMLDAIERGLIAFGEGPSAPETGKIGTSVGSETQRFIDELRRSERGPETRGLETRGPETRGVETVDLGTETVDSVTRGPDIRGSETANPATGGPDTVGSETARPAASGPEFEDLIRKRPRKIHDERSEERSKDPEKIPSPLRAMDVETIDLSEGPERRVLSEAEKTLSRITHEPTFRVKIGRARSVSPVARQPVILQRLRKKIVKPKDAVKLGLIDPETEQILNSGLLDEATSQKGSVKDLQTGDFVTINEAMNRGILNIENNCLTLPLNRSLTIPELTNQGLIDLDKKRIIHPETGQLLTLNEAMICDILNPESKILTPDNLTVKEALERGLINDDNFLNVDYIKPDLNTSELPPVGMTFQVAIERGLINGSLIKHPITGENLTVEDAVNQNLIMALPFKPNEESSVKIQDALNAGLINTQTAEFKLPLTGDLIPIKQALEEGYLTVKDDQTNEYFDNKSQIKTVTEFEDAIHTVTTTTVELNEGYAMVNKSEIKDLTTGEVMPIERAMELGVVKKVNVVKNKTVVKGIKPYLSESLTDQIEATSTTKESLVKDAAKKGLTAVLAGVALPFVAPVAAAMAVKDYVTKSSKTEFKEGEIQRQTEGPQSGTEFSQIPDKDPQVKQSLHKIESIQTKTEIESKTEFKESKIEGFQQMQPKKPQTVEPQAKIGSPESIRPKTEIEEYQIEEVTQIHPQEAQIGGSQFKTEFKESKIEEIQQMQPKTPQTVELQPKTGSPESIRPKTEFEEHQIEEVAQIHPQEAQIGGPQSKTEFKESKIEQIQVKRPQTLEPQPKIASPDSIEPKTEFKDPKVEGPQPKDPQIKRPQPKTDSTERPQHKTEPKDPKTESEDPKIKRPQPKMEHKIEKSQQIEIKTSQADQLELDSTIEMPLTEAVKLGLIEPKICRIIRNDKFLPYTVEDGLSQLKLESNTPVKILDNHTVVVLEKNEYLIVINKHLTAETLIKLGFYDIKTKQFVNPSTGLPITFENLALKHQLFNPHEVLVKEKHGKYVSLPDAFKLGLVDPKRGLMQDSKTGKRVSFFEAVKIKWIIDKKDKPKIKIEAINLKTACRSENFNHDDLTLLNRGVKLPLNKAIQLNVVNPKSVVIKNVKTGELVPYFEAIDTSLMDPQRALISNTLTGDLIPFNDAFKQGLILALPQSISLEALINLGLIQPEYNKVKDDLTGDLITLSQAIERHILDDKISLIKDCATSSYVDLNRALTTGLINEEGLINDSLTLIESSERGLIRTKPVVYTLIQMILQNYYDGNSGLILDPLTGDSLTLHQALSRKLIDPATTRIKDEKYDRIIDFNTAINDGLIDANNGRLTNPRLNLSEAYHKGYILSAILPWSLQEAIENDIYDSQSGYFIFNNEFKLSLTEAIKHGFINPDILTCKHPESNDIITLNEALNEGLINGSTGLTNKGLNLNQAYDEGLIVPYKRQITLPEAVFKGFYDPLTGRFTNPKNKEKLKTLSAINRGLIDVSSTLITINEEVKLTFDDAYDVGLINCEEGTLGDVKFNLAFKRGLMVEIKRPLSLSEGLHKGVYDPMTGLFLDPTNGENLTLIEAIEVNLIDGLSCEVRDTRLNKWRKMSLIDAVNSDFVNGVTGLVKDFGRGDEISLEDGFKRGILREGTPRDSLGPHAQEIESKTIGLKVPLTKISTIETLASKPSLKPGLKLMRGGAVGLIDAINKNLYNSANGKFAYDEFEDLSLKECIESNLIDPSDCVVKNDENNEILTLNKAIDCGLIDAIDGKLVCDNGNTVDLRKAVEIGRIFHAEKWQAMEEKLKQCEDTLSKLMDWMERVENQLAQQQPTIHETDEDLRNQINNLKQIKDDLEQHHNDIHHCNETVKNLVITAGGSETNRMEKSMRNLKNRYEKCVNLTEFLLRKINMAKDELNKLKNELNTFSIWLDRSRRILEEKEQNLSDLQHLDLTVGNTREFISDVIAHQADLRFITMSAQKLCDEEKDYSRMLNDFRMGLKSRLMQHPARDSPMRHEVSLVTQQYRDLMHRANMLSDRLSGVGGKQREYHEALGKLRAWLEEAEPRARGVVHEAVGGDPKIVEEQLKNAKALNNEFVNNSRLVDDAKQATTSLLKSLEGQISPTEIKRLDQPVDDLSKRYQKLMQLISEKCQELDTALIQSQSVQDALDNISNWLNHAENKFKLMQKGDSLIEEKLEEQLREFKVFQADIDMHIPAIDNLYMSANELVMSTSNANVAKKIEAKLNDVKTRFEKLYDKCQNRGVALHDLLQDLKVFNSQNNKFNNWYDHLMGIIDTTNDFDKLRKNINDNKALYEETVKLGKDLCNSKNDVTDTVNVRDKVKIMENKWKDLENLLNEKTRLMKLKQEHENNFDQLKHDVLQWLNLMEQRLNKLDKVSIDLDVLKQQNDELKPILHDHKIFNATINKISNAGTNLANLSHGFEESSMIQQNLNEINDRYNLIGVRINDRQNEIDTTRNDVKKCKENLSLLASFLDKIQRNLPKDAMPNNRDEADKINVKYKQCLEEMYEKQSLLDSTKAQVKDLIKNKHGANPISNELEDVIHHWKNIADHIKKRIKFNDSIKDFHDTNDGLNQWLHAKEKMLTVLGPVSSDARMVQNQVQQVQVLREEFRTQHPQLKHLIEIGDDVLTFLNPSTPDYVKVSNKVGQVQQKWADLATQLEERADLLGATVDTCQEFDDQLMRLRGNLQQISNDLDELSLNPNVEDQLRKIENLQRQLEGQRPLLIDLESSAMHLCNVLNDPNAKSDVQAKLQSVLKQYNNLEKRLENFKAETEGTLRDKLEFMESLSKTLGWLNDELTLCNERFLISAKRDVLEQQLAQHEPIYRDILTREHEIVMLLNRGRSMLKHGKQERDLDKIQQNWEKLRKNVTDKHTRLQTSWEHCKKYYKNLETFLPWLRQAEDKLDMLKPVNFTKKHFEKQLKELQQFRNDVWKKTGDYEYIKSSGETFANSCNIDQEIVQNELKDLSKRWDQLNNDLIQRTQNLENQSRKLSDFHENLRDLQHNLDRCEDKLSSYTRDPKNLDKIKTLKNECDLLKKPLETLRKQALDLSTNAEIDASNLNEEVSNLSQRLNDLNDKLNDRLGEMQSAATAITQFNDKIRTLSLDLTSLESELDKMKPIGRDLKTVRDQCDEIGKFLVKVKKCSNLIREISNLAQNLHDGSNVDMQVDNLTKQLYKIEERGKKREKQIGEILQKLETFYMLHSTGLDELQQAQNELRTFKTIASDVESIRQQQKDFKNYHKSTIEPLGKKIDEINKVGQGLIQSAQTGVNTHTLEKDLEHLNSLFNDLKEKINERERKLDIYLLQSGKFQEALDGLSKWLTDTEDLVANQKPPSADYKVVKAQLQEQKFLKKMLLDRQNSMTSLFNMGNEIAKEADKSERKNIEKQLQDLIGRFDNLTEGAQHRALQLEQAMHVAKEFQDKLTPLEDWLENTCKKVKNMEIVPTDEERIHDKIHEHDLLHHEILSKKPKFEDLTDVASNLMSIVGDDEAAILADKLQDLTDKYSQLVEASDHVGQLLNLSKQNLRHLVLTYQDLANWMDSTEKKLSKFNILAVHTEKLLEQMNDLTMLSEEIASKQRDVDSTVDHGLELMKHILSDEALQLKDKLDSLQRRYNDLTNKASDLLKNAQHLLPLVQKFYKNHNELTQWMQHAESMLQSSEFNDISQLESDLQELKPVLESVNIYGAQLCQNSPGEGASTIEGLVTRDNRRFDAISEQIQRRAERLNLNKQRALEVITDIDELLEWFKEVESQLKDADLPSADADVVRIQLKEHKALNDDISSQKSRVRDVISTAKKVLRESTSNDGSSFIKEKVEDLKDCMDQVSALSSNRLSILEQALPLAEHFNETHNVLSTWLNDIEQQVAMLTMPVLRADVIAQQQDKNEMLMQAINEHKPLVDKLNKTGEALMRICNEDDGAKVQEVMDSDNERYSALKIELRNRQQSLEQAMQESSKFTDKLEGMLRALSNTADQVNNLEPISALVPKLQDQIEDNENLIDDLDKRKEAYAAVKRAADDVLSKAGNVSDPAVKDIKKKLEKLKNLWDEVQNATKNRSNSLDKTLEVAQAFWKQLHALMRTLKDLEENLQCQEPPAVEPKFIQQQQVALQELRHEIDQTKPEVENVRFNGEKLMKLCGEPDKPEVKKHIEDLDNAWDNITALYAKREENLIDAMEKAMEFHETLQNLLEFLDRAEKKVEKMGQLGADIDAVKRQIDQLKTFKAEVDPHMVKVEALNRQAQELTERTTSDQANAIKEPLNQVNRRWDDLLRFIVNRQRQLENALLRLGQFQHALSELLVWIQKTDGTLNELKPVAGDPQILEIELAKLKVLVNDIQAHQTSVDTLNDAGREIIESGEAKEASYTQEKLNTLNTQWRKLMQKTADKQRELEDALTEAQRFNSEIQDLISWLNEIDTLITTSKPVGGLPETAKEQLERFMEIYHEIEDNRARVEACLNQGQDYLKKNLNPGQNLSHNLKTLKQRWESITARANDKKIKLEIALKEALDFHEQLQQFVNWLTLAEKNLIQLKPVSRVLETIQQQIDEHKTFQKDVSAHREVMLALDKKGTHLKYFSQKQDVILIKNLLISVQHRWERVASKSAERTRALDLGYKECKEFYDNWRGLMEWLDQLDGKLAQDDLESDASKIKFLLTKHQELQKSLASKQSTYDNTMKAGKNLIDKAPKSDETTLKTMLGQLKTKWNSLCQKSVEKQRKLEESLLYSGQFKEAMAALVQWLKKAEKELSMQENCHGDLDTVHHLIDLHKHHELELEKRNTQMESVIKTGEDLMRTANKNDANQIRNELDQLVKLWENVTDLTKAKSKKLQEALNDAEKLQKQVNMILDYLSDAEMKLRFTLNNDDNEDVAYAQLKALDEFNVQLKSKEREKNETVRFANEILHKSHQDAVMVIKNWIKVIESRWEEVTQFAMQRHQKLTQHVQNLKDMDENLEELIKWLLGLENVLLTLKREDLPMDIGAVEVLIVEHKEFMESTQKRQGEIDRVCRAKQVKPQQGHIAKDTKRFGKAKGVRGSQSDIHDSTSDIYGSLGRRQSRISPGREFSPDPMLPHIGPKFPPTGSEPEFRSPRVKFLYDKWRHVWMLSWERQRELNDHLNYLKEKEKADNFSWDDWRKRFLRFMNYKKSRLTDLFRKMDKDNNELIPRDDFIEGIIRTKFDTSRLEMKHVADMFDENNRGLIDWKKFIAALRPDWEEKTPDTDAQKIHDEVKRLVMLCTCRQKFRVFQVGEGKYRFGESQKLRLVRILRSTVMVRVGGGWVALDEFLVKNDPCRADEHLAELMPIFDEIRARGEFGNAYPMHVGPMTTLHTHHVNPNTCHWVRERSQRSQPMGKQLKTAGTPDSLSDNESGNNSALFRTPRRPSSKSTPFSPAGSRNSSRPASRTGSKHGSNLSLDSTDDAVTPSRIPRKTPTTTSGGRTTQPVKKSTAPTSRSSSRTSSRPHTPTSPAPRSASSRQVTVGVAPTLRTASRTRTPSGSNTPVDPKQKTAVTELLRKPSKTVKKTNEREPFRL